MIVPPVPETTFTVSVPNVNEVTTSGFPSTSLSLLSTFPISGLSSATVKISSTAAGASLTAATLISIRPVSVPPYASFTS